MTYLPRPEDIHVSVSLAELQALLSVARASERWLEHETGPLAMIKALNVWRAIKDGKNGTA